MAAEDDRKSERIFDDAGDSLINFFYEFLTQTRLALVVPLSRFRHIRLCRGGLAGGNSFCTQSGQNASFCLLPGGASFWILVVLVQARFDYRSFPFADFSVIRPCFIVEFIQLRPNLPPLFCTELGQSFEDLNLDHSGKSTVVTKGQQACFLARNDATSPAPRYPFRL